MDFDIIKFYKIQLDKMVDIRCADYHKYYADNE